MTEPSADDQAPDTDPVDPATDAVATPEDVATASSVENAAAGPPEGEAPAAASDGKAVDPRPTEEPATVGEAATPEGDAVGALPVDELAATSAEEPVGDPSAPPADEPTAPPTLAQGIRRSPLVAALLSTLVPGLGQLWAGSRRRAIIVAVPFVALVAVLVVVAVALVTHALDSASIIAFFLHPSTLVGVLVLDGLFLAYRVAAIVDAWWQARRRWPTTRRRVARATSIALLVVLLGVNVGLHAGIGYLDAAVADLDTSVLGGDSGPDALLPPDESLPPGDLFSATPGSDSGPVLEPPSAGPIVTPVPGPAWMADGRLNVLMLGVDAGPGRSGVRTDTMILASVDVATGKAAMFGIPRNLVNVPLPAESAAAFPDCRCFPKLLNALYTYAFGHSNLFPGGQNRGYRAVAGAIETLTGVRLDGVAIIDLNGFVDLVDALGGLRITIPQAIYDSHYPKPDGTGDIEIYIPAGRHRLDGITALEYARSRHSSSDYSRMRRQQAVLLALRAQIQPCNVITDLPKILKAVKGTVQTTFTPDDLPDLLRLAARVNPDKVQGFAFDPPDYPEWLGKADIQRIRTLVGHVFDPKSGGSGGSGASPTPPPTPNPFPTPIEDPCAA